MFNFSKYAPLAFALLFITSFANAVINISTASNAEIANFIVSEGSKVLQVPDTLVLKLDFQTASDKHGRAGILFFWGKREVSIKADYAIDLPSGQLKGILKADTSWLTGYCGTIECQNKPMPAQQRIEVLKNLVSRILAELDNKLRLVLNERKVIAPAPMPIAEDSVAPVTTDNITPANADSIAPAVADSTNPTEP
jgi:hypothetical protein